MKSGPPTTRRATDLLSRVGLAPWILLIGALLPLPGADGKIASLPSLCRSTRSPASPAPAAASPAPSFVSATDGFPNRSPSILSP